jgi:Ca-activated chloride channel homolog
LIIKAVIDDNKPLASASDNFKFSAAVAEFGLLLRNSEFKENGNYQQVISFAKSSKGKDVNGYRAEFISLVSSTASLLAGR